MSWDDGYVSEIGYTHGYYKELSPLHLETALLFGRVSAHLDRPLRYLELGFGQGLSLNIHAAANEGEFWGNDFNPSHALHAQTLARASGANLNILDDSFAQLLARDDLPNFDVIALHGVWSWISKENRQLVLEIIGKKLHAGGVVYISYNTTPGWSTTMPLRDLLMLYYTQVCPASMSVTEKIDASLAFAQQCLDSDMVFFKQVPAALDRLNQMKTHSREYLAHEYFNADWAPMPFAEIAGLLTDVNLTFAAYADFSSLLSQSHFNEKFRNVLSPIENSLIRQSIHDYAAHQQFRRDIWVKGSSSLSTLEQIEKIADLPFVALSPINSEKIAIESPFGEMSLNLDRALPIFDALKNSPVPLTANDLLKIPSVGQHLKLPEVIDMLLGLSCNHLTRARDPKSVSEKIKHQTFALNGHLMQLAKIGDYGNFLSSPITGGGVAVSRLQQLFLLILRESPSCEEEFLAAATWKILSAQGHRITNANGELLQNAKDSLAELKRLALYFLQERYPLLKQLEVY